MKYPAYQLLKWYREFDIFKTLRFNLHYLPFGDAIWMPIIVSKNLKLDKLGGVCKLKNKSFASIRLGFKSLNIFDNNKSKSIWHNTGRIEFEGKATLGNGFKLCVNQNGVVKIGNNFHMSGESTIISNNLVKIGNNCLFSWDILIMDTDYHKIYTQHSSARINPDTPNNYWKFLLDRLSVISTKGLSYPRWQYYRRQLCDFKKIESNSLYLRRL